MERLLDLPGRKLIVECATCERRGVYDLARLRRRYGDHACLWDVYLALTQTCRHQLVPGSRRPNVYGTTCRAKVDTDAPHERRTLPSRT